MLPFGVIFINEIRQQLNDKEQQELNNNVVIQGIPVKENENAQVLVDKIANTLKVAAKVKKAYRLHGPQNGKAYPPVKVVFENQDDKKQWMTAKRNVNLTARIFGGNNPLEPIYINHDLTKQNIEQAKRYKKEQNYKYLWVSNGKIFLRKNDTNKARLIGKKEDLKN